jgi:hypothetical protein
MSKTEAEVVALDPLCEVLGALHPFLGCEEDIENSNQNPCMLNITKIPSLHVD